ncbi:MAG: superinfection immunity protein [Sporichthyaceae bacterium]
MSIQQPLPNHVGANTDQRKGAARAASATWAWVGAICTVGYLLPWAVAANRGLRNSASIFWLNLLLGWTGVGWVVALVMALGRHQQVAQGTTVVVQQNVGYAPPAYGQPMYGQPSPSYGPPALYGQQPQQPVYGQPVQEGYAQQPQLPGQYGTPTDAPAQQYPPQA